MMHLLVNLSFIHRFEVILVLALFLNLALFFTLVFVPGIYNKPKRWVEKLVDVVWKRLFVKRS